MMTTRAKLVWSGAGLLTVSAVATVALHLTPVRALFGWKPLGSSATAGGGSCPFGYGGGESVAELPARPHATPTTPRPALGFTLDASTRSDVERWATEHDVSCTAQRGGMVLECNGVPSGALDGITLAATAVWFRFDGGRLAAIQSVRRSAVVDDVTSAFTSTELAMTKSLGTPTKRDGDPSVASLRRGALRQAMVEYNAPGYRATVRATNMGDGFALTESYAN